MSQNITTAHLIAAALQKRVHEGVRFGLIIHSLPPFDVRTLYEALKPGLKDIRLALLGFHDEASWLPDNIAKDVETAVAWRNNTTITNPLIIILNPTEQQDKIHSLELLEPFTDEELRRTICKQAEVEAKTKNDPLTERLWHELGLKQTSQYMPLVARQVTELYHALLEGDVAVSLPYIGLLPDPGLPNYLTPPDTFRKRLRENKRQGEWLLELDSQDHRTLARALSEDSNLHHRQTFRRIKEYSQNPTRERLGKLTLDEILAIRQAKKDPLPPPDVDTSGTESPPSTREQMLPDVYLIDQLLYLDLFQTDDQQKLTDFEQQAERISEMFYEDLTDDYEADLARMESPSRTLREKNLENEQYEVLIDYRTQEEVSSVRLPTGEEELHPLDEYMGVWVHPQCWGGYIHVEEFREGINDLPDLFDGSIALPFKPFKPLDTNSEGSLVNLFAALDVHVSTATTERLSGLLMQLQEHRRILTKYRKLFLYYPNWAIQDPLLRQAIQNYLETYDKLAKRLQQVCRQVQAIHPDAVARAAAQFLALDIVIIDYPDEISTSENVMLTSLHPLHLWKWFELGKLIRENQDSLNDKELARLREAVQNLPTLLNTFSLHEQMFDPPRHLVETKLVLAGEINNAKAESTIGIPYYKPVADQSLTIDGLSQFVRLFDKFLNLYPPARLGLTLVLVDPPQLSSILIKLVQLYKVEQLYGAKLYVYRTKEQVATHDVWQSKDDEALQLFRDNLQWILNVSLDCDTLPDISEDLQKRELHPHLVLLCDPSEAIVQSIFRTVQDDTTPFGVPVQLTYDSISDTIKLVPAPGGSIFNAYAGVRNSLSGELQRSVMGVGNRSADPKYLRLILNQEYGANWLVIIDWPHGTLEFPRDVGRRLAWQSAGSRTLAVHTNEHDWQRYWHKQLRHKLMNLQLPDAVQVEYILDRLLELFPILPEGLTTVIKEQQLDGYDAFDEDVLSNLLSIIVVLNWYRVTKTGLVIIPIGGNDFSDWYEGQKSKLTADYMALWVTDENELHVDVLTVHTVIGTFDEVPALSAARSSLTTLAQFANTLESLFDFNRHSLLAPLRRALLRERLTTAVFASSEPQIDVLLTQSRETKAHWASVINELFGGSYKPYIRLLDIRVALQEGNRTVDEQSYRHDDDDYLRVIAKLPATYLHQKSEAKTIQPDAETDVSKVSDSLPKTDVVQKVEPSRIEELEPAYEPKSVPVATIAEQAEQLRRVLIAYGIAIAEVNMEKSQIGSRFVRYWVKLQPPAGRLSEVQRYAEDIARELGSKTVPLIDNIPGERYIGIDLAREEPDIIPLAPSLTKLPAEQPNELIIAMGQNPAGEAVQLDLVRLPHMLVAGQTGSGKTIFLSALITSLVWRHTKEELELVLVDPKQMDFGIFSKLPHLYKGHILYEPEEAILALRELIGDEKDQRTHLIRQARCPNILEYNRRYPQNRLPWIVAVIDEFADIILSLEKKERTTFEKQINRLAATGRAVGIHLVVATQRPTTDVVTGTIKANIPARVSFRLPSQVDSRTILDRPGAENLLGQGDMLVSVDNEVQRLQGYYATYKEFLDLLGRLEK